MKPALKHHGNGRIADAIGQGLKRFNGGAFAVTFGDKPLCGRTRVKVLGDNPRIVDATVFQKKHGYLA